METRILNIDDVELTARPPLFTPKGEATQRFDSRTGAIGTRLGAQKLGYNLCVVPPGKRAFPLHNHHVNEELFFILEGSGELRVGTQTHAVRKGDFIACPPGGQSMKSPWRTACVCAPTRSSPLPSRMKNSSSFTWWLCSGKARLPGGTTQRL